jgi:hypothetical protein
LPNPYFPAHILDGYTATEDGDEGEKPLSQSTGGITNMAVFEWRSLYRG